MPFNHYAKLKRILESYGSSWYVVRVNEPTAVLNFRGELVRFEHYYRLCDLSGEYIKFGKFQQLDLFAKTMGIPIEAVPIVESSK